MKKFITFSLFIFTAIIAGVMVVGFISNKNNTNQLDIINSEKNLIINKNGLVLNMAEISKHNSASSCWLLISGKIYDVTTFLPNHSGEAKTILPTCGTDATQAYATKNKTDGRTHSANANSMLADYFIGNLNQTVNTSPTNPTNPPVANPNPTIPPNSNNREFDD